MMLWPNIGMKNTVLMSAAVAAGMRAVSEKTANPTLSILLVFAAATLAYFADPPRDISSRDRSTDNEKEKGGD